MAVATICPVHAFLLHTLPMAGEGQSTHLEGAHEAPSGRRTRSSLSQIGYKIQTPKTTPRIHPGSLAPPAPWMALCPFR
eukprot:6577424-Karenia_brevis.AAC.1